MNTKFEFACLCSLLLKSSVKKMFTIFMLSLFIFSSSNALAKERIVYDGDGPKETLLAQKKQSKRAVKDDESFRIANSYFENQAVIDFCVKSAIAESMIAGYHGTFSKAMYYYDQSLVRSDIKEKATFSMIAWFNIVNTKRIIDSAVEGTQHTERVESLMRDAAAVGFSIKLIGKSKFGWDKNEMEKMQGITLEILNKKIDEISKRESL